MQERIINCGYRKFQYVTHDPYAKAKYEAEMKYQLDLNTAIHAKQIEIAKNLKKLGIDIDLIVQGTGLPKSEIEKL